MYENLRKEISIPLLEIEDLSKLIKPIGKEIYKSNNVKKAGRPYKKVGEKVLHSDKIKCDICGRMFTRSNRTNHNNSSVHKAYSNINQKLYKLLLSENKNE